MKCRQLPQFRGIAGLPLAGEDTTGPARAAPVSQPLISCAVECSQTALPGLRRDLYDLPQRRREWWYSPTASAFGCAASMQDCGPRERPSLANSCAIGPFSGAETVRETLPESHLRRHELKGRARAHTATSGRENHRKVRSPRLRALLAAREATHPWFLGASVPMLDCAFGSS